jgi:DNA helicase HerA-like ATPase
MIFDESFSKRLEELLREADSKALEAGESIVGHVSRAVPIELSTDSRAISIHIPFNEYMESKRSIKLGSHLGIAIPIQRVYMLVKIIGIERADILSMAGLPDIAGHRDPGGFATPIVVRIEPICERSFDGGDILPPISPIEPQSPVFIPKPQFLREMLGIPAEGIAIGGLFEAGRAREDIDVVLNEKIIRHHILVIGTTGSGKTTLLTRIFTDRAFQSIALDIQGDYVRAMISSGIQEGYILVPVTKGLLEETCGKQCRDEDKFVVEKLPEIYAKRRGLPSPLVIGAKDIDGHAGIRVGFGRVEAILVPLAFRFLDIYGDIHRILPMMSPQASLFFGKLAAKCITKINNLEEFVKCVENTGNAEKIHSGTIGNIVRTIKAVYDSGVVGVAIAGREVGEPAYESLFARASKIALDLGFAMDYSPRIGSTMVAYRILSKLFEYRDKEYKAGRAGRPIIVVIDEAHEFFPQGGREGFEKEGMEEMINKIMRLGRVRGIGCIMATHRPQDLNDLVIELANTKIAFRSDEETLRRVGMEKNTKILETAPEGLGIIKTHAYRVSEIMFRTYLPSHS